MAKPWLILLSLMACQNALAVIRLNPSRHNSSAVTIPMREVELGSDHRVSRRQTDYGLTGGAAIGYTVQITVGSSQTPVNVLFDTGSADLTLASYNVPQDGSAIPTVDQCIEQYGPRAAQKGSVVRVPYALAGFQANSYICELNLGSNGILGMSYINPKQGVGAREGENPLTSFEGAGLSSFGVYLSNVRSGGGAFTPNDYDANFLAPGAGFAQEPVDQFGTGFWGLDLNPTFEYEGVAYDLGQSKGIIDTGNSGISLPPAAAQQIWQLTGADPSTGSYGSNCNPGGNPVTFTTTSGNRYSIPAAVYVIPTNDGQGCRSAFFAKTESGTANNPLAILGATWVRAYYTYFDIDNGLMYFAESGG